MWRFPKLTSSVTWDGDACARHSERNLIWDSSCNWRIEYNGIPWSKNSKQSGWLPRAKAVRRACSRHSPDTVLSMHCSTCSKSLASVGFDEMSWSKISSFSSWALEGECVFEDDVAVFPIFLRKRNKKRRERKKNEENKQAMKRVKASKRKKHSKRTGQDRTLTEAVNLRSRMKPKDCYSSNFWSLCRCSVWVMPSSFCSLCVCIYPLCHSRFASSESLFADYRLFSDSLWTGRKECLFWSSLDVSTVSVFRSFFSFLYQSFFCVCSAFFRWLFLWSHALPLSFCALLFFLTEMVVGIRACFVVLFSLWLIVFVMILLHGTRPRLRQSCGR